jgi:hypothetical protein
MTHYHKLAFTAIRVFSTLVIIYSVLSLPYVLRTYPQGNLIGSLVPVGFYLLLGILLFVFSKQIVKVAVRGIDRE